MAKKTLIIFAGCFVWVAMLAAQQADGTWTTTSTATAPMISWINWSSFTISAAYPDTNTICFEDGRRYFRADGENQPNSATTHCATVAELRTFVFERKPKEQP